LIHQFRDYAQSSLKPDLPGAVDLPDWDIRWAAPLLAQRRKLR
jgi:hypothetical protein